MSVKNILVIAGWLLLLGMCSCVSKRKLTYVKNTQKGTYIIPQRPDYQLQVGDNISIEIESTDPASSEFYNLKEEGFSGPYNDAFIYLNSHSVSSEGEIKIPILGTFKVEGKSLGSTTALLEKALSKHLKNASVFVKLVSFEITVLGEVKKPGNYLLRDNEANLFRVLGLAGDLTDFGKRRNVKIVRREKGVSRTIVVDLTDESVLTSEAYHLYPHDMVYVEPMRSKPLQMNLKPVGVLLSATTLIILILRTLN